MTIFFGVLLKENYLQIYFIKCLQKTFFVVVYLCKNILV